MHHVGDGLGHHVAARHLDQLRVLQHLVGEALDLVREGGREQQALALLGQQGEDALDVGDEAHVEHAVGFVEHQHLDLRQVDRLLLDVVEQPARRGDDDLDAAAQLGLLRADVDAAIDAHRAQRQVLAVGLDRLEHLHRELARGREDQRARLVAGGRGAGVGVARDAVQQRQREAGGLAGARLGAAHDVLAGDDDRDGLALDGRGFGVAGIGDGLQQFGNEAEVGKTHGCLRVWGGRQPTTGLRKARIIHRTKTFT